MDIPCRWRWAVGGGPCRVHPLATEAVGPGCRSRVAYGASRPCASDRCAIRRERQPIDLSATAALSLDLARLADQRELPALLARVADVLGARGVIVWMGADSELFAVAAHGYDATVLSRIRP